MKIVEEADRPPLLVHQGGSTVPCEENLFSILEFHDDMRAIRYDELSRRVVLTRELHTPQTLPVRYPRQWEDKDDHFLAAWLQRVYNCNAGAALVRACVDAHSRKRPYHQVRDYLNGLVWDGQQRIDNWLITYLGVEASDYARAVGGAFFVGAVARAMLPGCKMDTMLVLEGPQGIGKSRAIAALVPDERLFSDALDLSGDHRQMAEQLQGKWIVECAELGGLGRAEVEKVKAFLSRPCDHYRPPYGRTAVDHPRQCVLTGSTNADGYLRDDTGGRRFWPVRTGTLDVGRVAAERDQLWAEARVTYEAGADWWLPAGMETAAKEVQAARLVVDPWEEVVLGFAEGKVRLKSADLLSGPLGKPKGQWARVDEMRVGVILKQAGYRNKTIRENGTIQRWWVK